MMPKRFLPRASRQAGFSLIELLVSVVIMAEILVGVAILFDSSNRLARSQTHVAELQQSLRVGQSEVVRFARMAGIGGLPITRLNLTAHPSEPNESPPDYDLLGAFPRNGYAVAILNDVAAGTTFQTAGVPSSAVEVLEGSDVLILRGVFTTPLFFFDPPLDISTWLDVLPVDDREVSINNTARVADQVWEDYPQDIDALGSVLVSALGETTALHKKVPLILRDTLNPNAYAILELDEDSVVADLTPAACGAPSPPFPDEDCFRTMRLKLRLDTTTEPGFSYAKLMMGTNLRQGGMTLTLPAGTDPPSVDPVDIELPTSVGSIGLLEEYRFFVRVEYEVPGDNTTHLSPVLSRARFLPGTNEMLDRVDIADNVIDLQLAVGADANSPGHVRDGEILDNGGGLDEILFNSADDTNPDGTLAKPVGIVGGDPADADAAVTWYDPALEYHFLRINTLVQSRVPDLNIQAPALTDIEDHNRGTTVTITSPTLGTRTYNSETEYHRRWLQTVVELRNLL